MRSVAFLFAAACLSAQVRIEPPLATNCHAAGQTTVTVAWTAREPVIVQVAANGGLVPMTGVMPAVGSAQSGPWVTDAMVFVLTTVAGAELGRAQARVLCVAEDAASLFPLRLGNEWTYRVRNRQVTGGTLQLRVTNVGEADGQPWFEVRLDASAVYGWFRTDEQGRVWRRDRLTTPAAVWVDPANLPARVQVTPVGEFTGAVEVTVNESVVRTRRVFAAGVGLALLESFMLTGSSGGFLDGWELVAYRVGNVSREEPAEAALQLAAEASVLEVSGGKVSNCAVPCYFLACGFVVGTDPPGTYKPCFRAQATGRSATAGAQVELRLLDAAGAVLYRASQPLAAGARLQRQVPVAQPAGRYSLEGRVVRADGTVEQVSTLGLSVR